MFLYSNFLMEKFRWERWIPRLSMMKTVPVMLAMATIHGTFLSNFIFFFFIWVLDLSLSLSLSLIFQYPNNKHARIRELEEIINLLHRI